MIVAKRKGDRFVWCFSHLRFPAFWGRRLDPRRSGQVGPLMHSFLTFHLLMSGWPGEYADIAEARGNPSSLIERTYHIPKIHQMSTVILRLKRETRRGLFYSG